MKSAMFVITYFDNFFYIPFTFLLGLNQCFISHTLISVNLISTKVFTIYTENMYKYTYVYKYTHTPKNTYFSF